MAILEPIPQTPLRDNPLEDAIWKRWLDDLRRLDPTVSGSLNLTTLVVTGDTTLADVQLTADLTVNGSVNIGSTFTGSGALALFQRSFAGETRFTFSNSSGSSSATALLEITVGSTTSGDPMAQWFIGGSTAWTAGIDNSASDQFVIAAATTLGTASDVIQLTTGGDLTLKGKAGIDGQAVSSSTSLATPAATTAKSSIRLPHGSAPTSPVDGDMWTTTAGLFVRINGATVGPLT